MRKDGLRKMKRAAAMLTAALLCMIFAVSAFAEVYYVEDDEDDFTPPQTETTTAKPAETTASSPLDGLGSLFEGGALDGYFDRFSGMLDEGIDSLFSSFGSLNQDGNNNNGNSSNTQLPTMPSVPSNNSSSSITSPQVTTQPDNGNQTSEKEEQPTQSQERNTDLPSVLIVQNADGKSSGISGSTLTLVVFIAAIVILVFVIIIVLIIMTRRTEFNSTVMNKSAIPSAPQPDALSQFLDDDIADDGTDYGNISYWDN